MCSRNTLIVFLKIVFVVKSDRPVITAAEYYVVDVVFMLYIKQCQYKWYIYHA